MGLMKILTIDCRSLLLPKQWIQWRGVGMRDATRPFLLIETSLMDGGSEFIQPEFINKTVSTQEGNEMKEN